MAHTERVDLYHALNRGVDKRIIFLDTQDFARFVHDMYAFNDTKRADNLTRSFKTMGRTQSTSKRNLLVVIHGWCLMKNHYHILLSELKKGGMVKFMRKLNIGYAKYFNEKYKRSGTLFQGRTKKILIERDAHFLHILHYIHLNPLDYLPGAREWRKRHIKNANQALAHLSNYRWSSYKDYCGIPNFSSVINTKFFNEVFGNYEREIRGYLRELNAQEIDSMNLE